MLWCSFYKTTVTSLRNGLLEEFKYEGQTVMVAPLAGFYATKGLGTNQIRMAYVLKEEDLKAALKCLEVALDKYPGRVK